VIRDYDAADVRVVAIERASGDGGDSYYVRVMFADRRVFDLAELQIEDDATVCAAAFLSAVGRKDLQPHHDFKPIPKA
jgi:hypothetical protein